MFADLSNYFSEESREVLKDGVRSWHALKKQEDWNHWLRVGKAIAEAQDAAAKAVGQTSGRHFNAFMATCYSKPTYLGEFAEIDKTVRSHAAKCWRERDAIEKFRAQIGLTKAMTLNHPMAVWRAFEAWRRPPPE